MASFPELCYGLLLGRKDYAATSCDVNQEYANVVWGL
jgi:hypothetical protein